MRLPHVRSQLAVSATDPRVVVSHRSIYNALQYWFDVEYGKGLYTVETVEHLEQLPRSSWPMYNGTEWGMSGLDTREYDSQPSSLEDIAEPEDSVPHWAEPNLQW